MAIPTPGPPPPVLALGADPVRWALMRELSQSDRQVDELVDALKKPQNLVSYHLGKLRAAQVISVRRSSHDARGLYYRLDLPRCQELLSGAVHALHQSLEVTAMTSVREPGSAVRGTSVLFLCTANSARSQMAEGLLRAAAADVSVASAGNKPSSVHPNAIRAMKKRGIDISGQTSKHLDGFRETAFDTVVTVCDHLKEECPDVPRAGHVVHWSIPDPVSEGENAGKLSAFERVADELAVRVQYLIPVLRGA
ncbi:ArsR family transcriptional regulator [bacterium]|nr:ArsR family transcriptional regulator [bacterium]